MRKPASNSHCVDARRADEAWEFVAGLAKMSRALLVGQCAAFSLHAHLIWSAASGARRGACRPRTSPHFFRCRTHLRICWADFSRCPSVWVRRDIRWVVYRSLPEMG